MRKTGMLSNKSSFTSCKSHAEKIYIQQRKYCEIVAIQGLFVNNYCTVRNALRFARD